MILIAFVASYLASAVFNMHVSPHCKWLSYLWLIKCIARRLTVTCKHLITPPSIRRERIQLRRGKILNHDRERRRERRRRAYRMIILVRCRWTTWRGFRLRRTQDRRSATNFTYKSVAISAYQFAYPFFSYAALIAQIATIGQVINMIIIVA